MDLLNHIMGFFWNVDYLYIVLIISWFNFIVLKMLFNVKKWLNF